jgi:hypothetical protein
MNDDDEIKISITNNRGFIDLSVSKTDTLLMLLETPKFRQVLENALILYPQNNRDNVVFVFFQKGGSMRYNIGPLNMDETFFELYDTVLPDRFTDRSLGVIYR